MRTRCRDLDDEAQRTLLAEPDRAGRRWFTVQHAIAAKLVGKRVDQPLGPPGTAGLLVRDAGQCQLALQLVVKSVEVDVSPHRRRRAALHIDNTTAVNFAISDGATPGIARPGVGRTGGEDIDVAIENEVLTLAAAIERADNVGPIGLGAAVFDRSVLRPQAVVEESGGTLGIARGIGARLRHEVGQKFHDQIAIAIDPGKQCIPMWRHLTLSSFGPINPPWRARPQVGSDRGAWPRSIASLWRRVLWQ